MNSSPGLETSLCLILGYLAWNVGEGAVLRTSPPKGLYFGKAVMIKMSGKFSLGEKWKCLIWREESEAEETTLREVLALDSEVVIS